MEIISQLEQLGFVKFPNIFKPDSHSSWQLRVCCPHSEMTMYFVNVDLTDYNNVENSSFMPSSLKEDLVPEYEVQFNNEYGTFNVDFFGTGKKVEEALEFYENVFKGLNCFNYDD